MKLEDLAMVSPIARQEAIDLLKKGKWDRSKSGQTEELRGALLQELEDTMTDLGQDSLSYLNALSKIYSQVNAATVEDVTEEEEEKPSEEVVEVLLQDLPVPLCYKLDGSGEVPAGGLIIPDAVEVFLSEHHKAEVKGMVTATESEKIRVFFPVVNHARREECIFDEGSQASSLRTAPRRER
ncbi:hypothetical protein H1R20_g4998, partial [Candolleomyces eurysporus]